MNMQHKKLIDHSGDPVIGGGLFHSVGCSRATQAVQALSGSLRTQPQDDSPHPSPANRQIQSHYQEAPEHDLSTTTAAHGSQVSKNDRDTGFSVAKARQDPQNTHARATSCGMYTCSHRRCR